MTSAVLPLGMGAMGGPPSASARTSPTSISVSAAAAYDLETESDTDMSAIVNGVLGDGIAGVNGASSAARERDDDGGDDFFGAAVANGAGAFGVAEAMNGRPILYASASAKGEMNGGELVAYGMDLLLSAKEKVLTLSEQRVSGLFYVCRGLHFRLLTPR